MKAPSVQIPVSIMTYSYYRNSHDDEYHPLPRTNERTKRNAFFAHSLFSRNGAEARVGARLLHVPLVELFHVCRNPNHGEHEGDRGYRGIRETAVPIGRVPKSSAAHRVLAKKIGKRLEGGVKGWGGGAGGRGVDRLLCPDNFRLKGKGPRGLSTTSG